jgi:hypothetical protein
MTRLALEHIVRAAGSIADSDKIVVIGSQAILGSCPLAPEELLVSQEADVFPLESPEKADLIDGSIGEMSPFHEQFGYYAHGVGPETAILPSGWKSRLVKIHSENTRGVFGLCLHPADLAISKLAAGRVKDIEFVRIMIKNKIVSVADMDPLIETLEISIRQVVRERLNKLLK